MSFWRSPTFPIAVLLVIGPGIAVAQFRTMAPAVTIAFVLTVAAHWRATHRLPWPQPTALLGVVLALMGWGMVSALWAPEPARAVETPLTLAGLTLLGAAAARAVEDDRTANRARLGAALIIGLGIGIVLAAFDHAAWNLFRRAVRGMPEWTPFVGFGLKPAVSLLALFLPLVTMLPGVPRIARGTILAAGLATCLWLPAESAKFAVVAGLGASLLAWPIPSLANRISGALLAALFVATPLVFATVLERNPDASRLPFSAAHRLLIWDFAVERIAEKPLLGWGMEASRAIPGGTDGFDTATLDRFNLVSPAARSFFGATSTQRLPLHTHNAALQVWLELGLVGAVLAAGLVGLAVIGAGTPAALGAAVSGSVTALLSFGVWQPWWVASLLLLLVVVRALPR